MVLWNKLLCVYLRRYITNLHKKMKNLLKTMFRAVALAVAVLIGSAMCVAAETEITEEFAEEGIAKAEVAMANIARNLDEITTMEQLEGLQRAVNTMEFRNVRKKYGKIVLTDAHKERLVEANKLVAKAMKDMLDRLGAPFDVREALASEISDEKIVEEIAKAKTLRETMQ